MQPLVEHRLELGGLATRALELEGQGPPVLLLHGFADSADTWRLVLDRLARANRRALALDLPGFGRAARLDRERGVLEQLDVFAAAAIEHLAAEAGEDVVVAGNSLGGCLALRAAEDPRRPLAGIVPIAPAGFDHPVWFRSVETAPVIRAVLRAPVPLPPPVVRSLVGAGYRQLAFARPRAVERSVVGLFTAHHRSRRDVVRYLGTGRALLPELGPGCFRLDRIEVPVLLLWGDRDRMVSFRGARHVVDALPDTESVVLAGIGHCPQLEAPDEVAARLLAFASAPART